MTTYAYIDNSNLYIEGCPTPGGAEGAREEHLRCHEQRHRRMTWNIEYGRLYEFLCGKDAGASLWGSPPPGDSFWKMLDRKGFNTTIYDKNPQNKEKNVDVAIGARLTKDAFTLVDKKKDDLLLVAGDGDFMPVIEDLKSEGFKIEVAFWDHAAREIRETVTNFISLNKYQKHLTL